MSNFDLQGNDQNRRQKLHTATPGGSTLYGLDYLEVADDDHRILTVYFIGAVDAVPSLTPANVRIDGGTRIRNLRVTGLEWLSPQEVGGDAALRLTLDRAGDASKYTLNFVQSNEDGRPGELPLAGFDPRYSRLDFRFIADLSGDLDNGQPQTTGSSRRTAPEINYLAKDYASFRQLLLDRLAVTIPGWQEKHAPDLGLTLVEIMAYSGDYLSYYQDAVATEAYLATARQRISVRRHARLLDYYVHEGCNARSWVCLNPQSDTEFDPAAAYFITAPQKSLPFKSQVLTQEDLLNLNRASYDFQIFEPVAGQTVRPVYPAHNRITFYTWGYTDCWLPLGATGATLDASADALNLTTGEVLIFEEIAGRLTGNPADADPARRQAVRLTSVVTGRDPLFDKLVVNITWAEEDRLKFRLCLTAFIPAPAGEYREISVARGNVVLVDHGETVRRQENGRVVKGEVLGQVPTIQSDSISSPDNLGEKLAVAGPFRPILQQSPLTHAYITSPDLPAAQMLQQDYRQALPQITLQGETPNLDGFLQQVWWPRQDLLNSRANGLHFVTEIDNKGAAHLRFGDSELGSAPLPATVFTANYRVGNGVAGNVGAETISYIVLENASNIEYEPRNPLPAQGGVEPESLETIKALAPGAFRHDIERAITADDYASFTRRILGVREAAARLVWTGSWHEAQVMIAPVMPEAPDPQLLKLVEDTLKRYKRNGHDLRVELARYVGLDLGLAVGVLPHYLRGHVKAAILETLSNRVQAGGGFGFFHPARLGFGKNIYLSQIVALVQSLEGVERVRVTRLERVYEGPNNELENGVLVLGPLEIARLDNDLARPENGILRLEMSGG